MMAIQYIGGYLGLTTEQLKPMALFIYLFIIFITTNIISGITHLG